MAKGGIATLGGAKSYGENPFQMGAKKGVILPSTTTLKNGTPSYDKHHSDCTPRGASNSLARALTHTGSGSPLPSDHDTDLPYRVPKKYRVSQDDEVVLYGMRSTQHAIISQS